MIKNPQIDFYDIMNSDPVQTCLDIAFDFSAMGRYDDIINLPHYVSKERARMPKSARAAQFAPFAALSGHEELIEETGKQHKADEIERETFEESI